SKQPEQSTLVSVGHRPELEAFHNRKIVLERRRGGAKLVSDIELVRKPGRARLLYRFLRNKTCDPVLPASPHEGPRCDMKMSLAQGAFASSQCEDDLDAIEDAKEFSKNF